MDELDPRDRMMVEGLYWWGVPSLFRCPVDPDPAACDIALVGVPHSSGNGSTERDQHLGPRAVRNVSALQRRYHLDFGLSPWEACRIHDLGDVPLPEANDNERCIERITGFFARRSLGGDSDGRDRRRPQRHRRHRPGPRRPALEADGRTQGGAPPPRRPHRRLRDDPALARRAEVGRALGELPRPRGPDRSVP